MKILFEDKKAHRVYAMCNSNNAASYRTMEKLGMIREGVFREELPWRGKWVDQFYYAVLDHEYFARNDKHESC